VTQEPLFVRLAHFLRGAGVEPGDTIPSESALTRRLGVGRQQIREALSALEALGALRSRRGSGRVWIGFDLHTYVLRALSLAPPTPDMVQGLLEVRQALETSFLSLAVTTLDAEHRHRLRELADGMVERANAGRSFSDLDRIFHLTLAEPLNNPVLEGILTVFWQVFDALPETDVFIAEDPKIAAMHGYIVDAIEQQDVKRAVHELDAHFYGVKTRFAGGSHPPSPRDLQGATAPE